MAPHPRIAVSSPHMSTFAFEELLPRVADAFAVWEVFGEGRQYLFEIEDAFKELTPSYDLDFTAHAPVSDINPASFNAEVRALARSILKRTVEAAGRLGIPRVTVHPGLRMPMARWDDDRLRRLTLEAAEELAAVGREVGVEVCLENMAKNWVMTFQDPEWFGDAFGRIEGLTFCYDVAHAHTNSPEHVETFTRAFAPHVGNVHLSDNDGANDSHWVLGRGTVPLGDAVRGLEAAGYRGNYVIESNTFEEGVESIALLESLLSSLDA
ncbi:MAG: sugar phosphate isomerase/epimerase [Euryarchaeota archaeon]|nr:sugar phosphate isomerase/epimerase [Euryarchaeota archaeon]